MVKILIVIYNFNVLEPGQNIIHPADLETYFNTKTPLLFSQI